MINAKINAKKLKRDFPVLKNKIVYLDNAATTQKPNAVIEAVMDFYLNSNANVHRGMYSLSMDATKKYENARRVVANFINAGVDEIVFARGTTESLNLLAFTLPAIIEKGRNKIVLTEVEHHANLIPWQEAAKRLGWTLDFIRLKHDLTLDDSDLKKLDGRTAIFAFTGVSNVLGLKVDVKKYCDAARKAGALSIVDAAQMAPHQKIDVKLLGCDFLAFSSHKMLGPSGVGALYGRRELLSKMPPFNTGGSMISEVNYASAAYAPAPAKFEAGTPNMEGAVGFAAAIKYLENTGIDKIEQHENELTAYALKELGKVNGVVLFHSPGGAGIVSFNIKGVHAHDVTSLLDDSGICVRAGHHCNMPLMNKLGLAGTVRASFYIYNTKEDIDLLVAGLKKIIKMFNK